MHRAPLILILSWCASTATVAINAQTSHSAHSATKIYLDATNGIRFTYPGERGWVKDNFCGSYFDLTILTSNVGDDANSTGCVSYEGRDNPKSRFAGTSITSFAFLYFLPTNLTEKACYDKLHGESPDGNTEKSKWITIGGIRWLNREAGSFGLGNQQSEDLYATWQSGDAAHPARCVLFETAMESVNNANGDLRNPTDADMRQIVRWLETIVSSFRLVQRDDRSIPLR
jgi:hypothetical protein